MSKKITFTSVDEYGWDVVDRPYPASQNIPSWWKNMSPYRNGNDLILSGGTNNGSPKKCRPMLDYITSGYIFPLWADIQIKNVSRDGSYLPEITWNMTHPMFEMNTDYANDHVVAPEGYASFIVKLVNRWMVKTPPGYSIIVNEPIGHKSLPLQAVPGIVDTDRFRGRLAFPMWIKEGFEGIVERGTPLVQITPFKRDNWNSEFDSLKDGDYERLEEKTLRKKAINHYIQNQWTKKNYK